MNSKYLIELNDTDFNDTFLTKYPNKIVLVKFYTTWCKYCQESIPEYNKLADLIKNDSKIIIAQIDCDKYTETINNINKFEYSFKIKGYPTIIIFKDNKMLLKYKDNRTVPNYLNILYKISEI